MDAHLSLLNHNNTFSLLLIAIEYKALKVAQISQLIKLFSIDQLIQYIPIGQEVLTNNNLDLF